jgi:predicted nucleic acid-binding protein
VTSVVVDASVIVAMVVADERRDAARAHLQRWVEAGDGMHAPAGRVAGPDRRTGHMVLTYR